MPIFEKAIEFPRPRTEVFDFFVHPQNLLRVSPPDLHMQLVEAPERLQFGSRLVLTVRRFGITQRGVSEITAFEEGTLFRDEQREGPFGKWAHTHRFESVPAGTRVVDHLEYEAPGGLLGLVVTERLLARELEAMWDFRTRRLAELLGGKPVPV